MRKLRRGKFIPKKKEERKKNLNGKGFPLGRPRVYTREVGEFICDELKKGRTLTKICQDPNVPCLVTVFKWLSPTNTRYNAIFLKSYKEARAIQAEVWADMTDDISNDGSNDTYETYNKKTGEREVKVDHDVIQRSALRVKTKQWLAAHLLPTKFSDRHIVTGEDGKPLIPTDTKLIVNFIGGTKEEEEEK